MGGDGPRRAPQETLPVSPIIDAMSTRAETLPTPRDDVLPARMPVREAIRYCLGVFLAVRVGLLVLGIVAVGVVPPNDPADVPGWPAPAPESGWSEVGAAFERWDGLWFLRISEDGYRENDGSAAFFPLYPLATKVVATAIGGHPLPASLILSNVALFFALVAFYLLSRLEFDKDTAEAVT